MRIAIFEPHPSFQGGSERIALDIGCYLANRNHEVFLLHDSEGTMLPTYDKFLNERRQLTLRGFGWRTLGASLRQARVVAHCWRSWAADLVFSSDVNYLRFLALAGCFARIPVGIHLGIPNPLPYFSQRLALRGFAAGVAPSSHTAETWLRDGWPFDRLHIVSNGVDTTRFRPTVDRNSLRKRLQLPEGSPIVLFVGRLVPEKGVSTLLEAFKRLRKAHKQSRLVLLGVNAHGNLTPWLEEARCHGLSSDAVWFAGRQTNPEDYLAAADLAVVPSEWDEPFGLVALEAMACGTPPIVSDRGVLPELVGCDRQALVFPAGQAERLAERMGWWLENDVARTSLGKELASSVVKTHELASMGDRYEQIFVRIGADGRSVRSKAS